MTAEIIAPSLADFERHAAAAFATIPATLRRHAEGVAIVVLDFPPDEVVSDMELESDFDILGLYHGVALTQKSVSDVPGQPDMVFLYRRPILDYWCESGEDLVHIIRHVLIHEIGHHFGFSDDDMDGIEQQDGG